MPMPTVMRRRRQTAPVTTAAVRTVPRYVSCSKMKRSVHLNANSKTAASAESVSGCGGRHPGDA